MIELQVILIVDVHELIDLNVLLDAVLIEVTKQDLVILDELLIKLGVPLNLAHVEMTRLDSVHELAVD